MAVDVEFDSVSDEDFDSFRLESVCDETLFLGLKDLRKQVAHKLGLPPYVVFQDPSLEDMAIKYPITKEELANINGVGKNKALKFGAEFVRYIDNYVRENDIERPIEVVLKGNSEKSAKRVNIILNIDKKVDLPVIATQLGISFDELLEELQQIVNSGTKLNIRYFLDQFLDEDLQDEVIEYFKTTEEENIDAAVESFDGEFSHEELKLMHLQFISDVAN
jgi:ATP-dependent DNA helicase RecQ